jgi:TonB family protein
MDRRVRSMTAAMHHLFERRPLAGAMGVGLVAHVAILAVVSLVVNRGVQELDEETVDVVPLDEETARHLAAQIERAAAPTVEAAHGAPPQEAQHIADRDNQPVRETRVRVARLRGPAVARPLPASHGEEGTAAAPTHASALLPPGMGERAPATREPPRELPRPPAPAPAGHPAALPRKVAVTETIEAAPAVIAPVADQAVVRARASALALFLHQVEAAIARHWFPQEVYTRVDPAGNISGVERRTAMQVRIRADGSLERIDIQSSSGVAALDEEARAAFQRSQPFPRPSPLVLDSRGGLTFPFSVTLDLEMARWKSDVKRMVGALWRPRGRIFIDQDRTTVVKALLGPDGTVAHVAIDTSSGNPFIDGSALSAIGPGMRFPKPPRSLEEVAGMRPIRIAFMHRFRGEHDLQVLVDAADE